MEEKYETNMGSDIFARKKMLIYLAILFHFFNKYLLRTNYVLGTVLRIPGWIRQRTGPHGA